MKLPSVCLLGMAVVLSGCISRTAGLDTEGPKFEKGRTTRREVVERWGNPDSIAGDVWSWREWRVLGSEFKIGYMMVGFTVANAGMVTCDHVLTFDGRGILVDEETKAFSRQEVEWEPFPW